MNDATAELLALSKEVYATAEKLMKEGALAIPKDTHHSSTMVAPFILAAKMFLTRIGIKAEDQRLLLQELIEKVYYGPKTGTGVTYLGN